MKISLLFITILFVSCVQHKEEEIEISEIEDEFRTEVEYAQGFDIEYQADFTNLITHSFGENEHFRDSLLFVANAENPLLKGSKKTFKNIESLVCLSSTYLYFLKILEKLDYVTGLCGMQYVQNEDLINTLDENKVQEICMSENVEIETLLGLNSDLFLIYPFGESEKSKYENAGIQTLLIAEYLEKTQLARLEWIKVFGMLMGELEMATAYFDEVKSEYVSLQKEEQDSNKKFILNLPYQDSWFMPSTNSLTVNLLKDAGLSYYYQNEIGTENILHPKEEVWNDGIEANYWVIIASRPVDFTLEDLIEEEPVYAKFKSVIHHQVIFCNTATTDYFSKGVVEPQLMLKDLLFATHQMDNYSPKYFHILE